jgi:hypothetical protein
MYRWVTLQLGPFDTCYRIAKEKGYEVVGMVYGGIKLFSPKSGSWATITPADSRGLSKHWDLIKYDHEPNIDDPRFD